MVSKLPLNIAISAIAISLNAAAGPNADGNPFSWEHLNPQQNAVGAGLKLAMGMCGGMGDGSMGGMPQDKESGAMKDAGGRETEAGHAGMKKGMAGMEGMCGGMMARIPIGVPPEALPDSHSVGARALTQFCTQCHGLPAPGLHTAREWPMVVDRMNGRMQMMAGMMGLKAPSRAELNTVVGYLQDHAQRPIDRATYASELQTAAGKTFSTACSQCHALPDPTQHAADEWPGVVWRMKGHMAVRNKRIPSEAQVKEILSFLERNAKTVR